MRRELKSRLLSTLAVGALACMAAGPARADDTAAEIRLLKAQLRKLEQKVAAQERATRETKVAVARVAVSNRPGVGGGGFTKGPLPALATCPEGTFCYKGIRITPGGYLDFATIYRTRNLESDLSTPWNSIPFGDNRVGRANETRFTARASRFALKIQGDINPVTHVTGYGEIDFQGAAQTANSNGTNSFQPRLRQAWVNVDRDDFGFHVAAGQTWSLATMFAKGLVIGKENIPTTIDQNYLPGFTLTRQPQIRITKDIGPFTIGLSAENPSTTVSGSAPSGTNAIATSSNTVTTNINGINAVTTACGGFSNNGVGINATNAGLSQGSTNGGALTSGFSGFNACNTNSLNRVPDFVAKAAVDPTVAGRTIHLEGYALGRDFYSRTGTTTVASGATSITSGSNKDVFGGGVGGSFLIPVFPKYLEIQGSALFGEGIGRYGAGGLPDVTFGPTGTLKPIQETQLLAGVTAHPFAYLDLFAYAGQEEAQRASVGTGGYGNINSSNAGCGIEASTLSCNGATRRLRQVTGGAYYTAYKGAFGKLQLGAQYSYTERLGFSSISGPAPKGTENIVLTSLRYFPF